MAYQAVFKRYELKFMLTTAQKETILRAMEPYMSLDKYGRTTIRNLYFDTDNYRLIRHSMEKPVYKEKLRIRSYRKANAHSLVYVELKKKYQSVVYKRRVSMTEQQALDWLCEGKACPMDSQITREIDYFLWFYGSLHPVMALSYEREAYCAKGGGDFRITFDDNILCRWNELSLETEAFGTPILEGDTVLMEVKCSGGLPLWLTKVLTREKIYKTSFSKYGAAYTTMIHTKTSKENINYA